MSGGLTDCRHVAKRNGGRMPAKGKCALGKSCGFADFCHVAGGARPAVMLAGGDQFETEA